MWAGGELVFRAPLRVGDEVVKTSVVEDIAFKSGASGPLGFVTMRHTYTVGATRAIEERQDLVYRPPPAPGAAAARPQPAKTETAEIMRAWDIATDPVMLARYSMATFNGHRIHYDAPYATGVEGYAGLVVHGPMLATLMLNVAADALGATPRRFRYRGLAAVICGTPFRAEARRGVGEAIETRIVTGDGVVAMAGVVEPG